MRVTCTCCHRVEDWRDNQREVIAEGGLRVPHPNETIAAYRAIQSAQSSPDQRVVAVCSQCQQPMVATTTSLDGLVWPLTMADGAVVSVQTSPLQVEGHTTLQALDDRITEWEDALHRNQSSYASRVFEGSLLGMMLVPFMCWLFAVGMVILYLNHFFTLE